MDPSQQVRPARAQDEAAIRMLLGSERSQHFVLSDFLVLEVEGQIVGCGAVRNVPEGGSELAQYETLAGHRGHGRSRALLAQLILNAHRPLYTLTLPPVLAEYAGFTRVAVEDLPVSLQARARRLTEKHRAWSPMRLRGSESSLLRIPSDPDFPQEW